MIANPKPNISKSEEQAKRVVVYIDGLNLHYGILGLGFEKYLWLDLAKLGQQLTEDHHALIGVEYFTARFKKDQTYRPGRHERQAAFLAANRRFHPVNVHESYFVAAKCDCANCFKDASAQTEYRFVEKLTDTHIASLMIGDAVRDRYDIAILVSRDSDLAPPVKEIRSLFPDKQVIVAAPNENIGKRLRNAASHTFVINERAFADSQLPDTVTARRGKLLTRPEEWSY